MKYSSSALVFFASLAIAPAASAQQATAMSMSMPPPLPPMPPTSTTSTTSATTAIAAPLPLVFNDDGKCPEPIGRNDKGCRCISIDDYDDLKGAIERMDDGECKCFEPFSVQKQPHEPEISIDNTRKLQIMCKEFRQCEINGEGSHLTIEGDLASATISGFRFLGATESAIVVRDGTGTGRKEAREQIFCDNEFVNNENSWSDGGAIKVGTGAKIFVGNSYFESNTAARMGGAISGNASILQVLDSSFKANAAKLGGAIATNQPEAKLVLGGCDFDDNDAMMGPKFGPAVAANGLVEDLGENEAQPEDLMCLGCELVSGTRIQQPQAYTAQPQLQPQQQQGIVMPPPLPLSQQEDVTMTVSTNGQDQGVDTAMIDTASPLDASGMGVLLPTGDGGAPLVVVEEEEVEDVVETIGETNEEVEGDADIDDGVDDVNIVP